MSGIVCLVDDRWREEAVKDEELVTRFAGAILKAKEAVETSILLALQQEFGAHLASQVKFQLRVKEIAE